MELTEEIKNTAQALGRTLHQEAYMRTYLEASEEFRADPEARQLEEQLFSIYNDLIARQQRGEKITREDMQPFFELRRQAQMHPLISKRDNALQFIKPYLVEIAEEISLPLGMDYTALVKPD